MSHREQTLVQKDTDMVRLKPVTHCQAGCLVTTRHPSGALGERGHGRWEPERSF